MAQLAGRSAVMTMERKETRRGRRNDSSLMERRTSQSETVVSNQDGSWEGAAANAADKARGSVIGSEQLWPRQR